MIQTATFPIFQNDKIPDCEIKDSLGLFEATANFKIQYKLKSWAEVQTTSLLRVISRHFSKKASTENCL